MNSLYQLAGNSQLRFAQLVTRYNNILIQNFAPPDIPNTVPPLPESVIGALIILGIGGGLLYARRIRRNARLGSTELGERLD